MSKNDGGPAFPRTVQHYNEYLEGRDGMSLRDWFAGQALLGMLNRTQYNETIAASYAFKYADAMLAERNK
jgi:hypothetical protein